MQKKKILIVEDDAAYRKFLHLILMEHAYDVLEANNGISGLSIALKYHPDLIILDRLMPGMDGLTMLNELRKDQYGKQVKVIILTNLDPDDETIQTVVKAKPAFYCVKTDIKLDELLQKIKELLG